MTSPDRPGVDTRPLVVVTTDPELDDLNSMLRLLLYANDIRIAGLVYSSSMFHAAGDPARAIAPHRWPPASYRGHIHEALDSYAQVWDNLTVHDPRYPPPTTLYDMVATGNISTAGDMEAETDGSRLIERVLTAEGDERVFLQAWGGFNTIARALKSIEERAKAAGTWEEVYTRVISRAVLTSFGNQDSTYESYIRPHWPEIEHRQVATLVWGYFAWEVTHPSDRVYLGADWTTANVSTVGPVGAAYRVWGDGRQMAEGFDDEDYFGIRGATVSQLEERGYRVWCPLREPGSWISEGDSSNFAILMDNGLRSWENPGFGGWGGRQVRNPLDPHQWTSDRAADELPTGMHPVRLPNGREANDYHAARWFGPIQRDFAARLRWSVTPVRTDANHHPTVVVHAPAAPDAGPGDEVAFRVTAEDPDGDTVTLSAWHYREAGTCSVPATVAINDDVLTVGVPREAGLGETLHIIVEGTDDGTPRLVSYARIVIQVK